MPRRLLEAVPQQLGLTRREQQLIEPSCHHARLPESTPTRIFLRLWDLSPDFKVSVVMYFPLPLLLSFNAACAAPPACKPCRAPVFIISNASEFMELSCGAVARIVSSARVDAVIPDRADQS
jgi:hypothetical protein